MKYSQHISFVFLKMACSVFGAILLMLLRPVTPRNLYLTHKRQSREFICAHRSLLNDVFHEILGFSLSCNCLCF